MKYWITLLGILLCGCVSHRPPAREMEVRLEAFHPQSMHRDFDDGSWATYDAVVLRILSPAEWKGKRLTIYCHPEDTNAVFKMVGDFFRFDISEDLLRQDTDGSLFLGALRNLKRIEQHKEGRRK